MAEERKLKSLVSWIWRLDAGGVNIGSVLGWGKFVYASLVRSHWEVGPLLADDDGVGINRPVCSELGASIFMMETGQATPSCGLSTLGGWVRTLCGPGLFLVRGQSSGRVVVN